MQKEFIVLTVVCAICVKSVMTDARGKEKDRISFEIRSFLMGAGTGLEPATSGL